MRDIDKIIVHCSDSGFGDASVINDWHIAQGWSGIGYHFVILNGVRRAHRQYDEAIDGIIEAGRPLDTAGAHCQGHNSHSIGICLIGDKDFTEKQMDSLYKQVMGLMRTFKLGTDAVLGHYELDTHGKTCPNLDMAVVRSVLVAKLMRG